MFVDEVDIDVSAGDGGNGCVSFRRERGVPKGGPNGGDGGSGGSIFLRASQHRNTLINFKFHPLFRAKRGSHGQGSNRAGRTGADLFLDVPPGTLVYTIDGDQINELADLTSVGQQICVAKGGDGGRGNQHFASSTNRAPRRVESGYPGHSRTLRLQLKLLADVGLVGYPNAGKSTLIAQMSSAKPKISNYPFTTLTPNLGVVMLDDSRSFVLADVPGLIQGAHLGHGLGHRFLSHLQRTKVLVHVIDISQASGRDPIDDFENVRQELAHFPAGPSLLDASSLSQTLAEKPQLAVANKMDVLDDPNRLKRLSECLAECSIPLYPISAVTGKGIRPLQEAMWKVIEKSSKPPI